MDKHLIIIKKLDERFWGSCDEIELAYSDVIASLKHSIKVSVIEFTDSTFKDAIQSIDELAQETNLSCYIFFLSHNINFNPFLEQLAQHKETLKICLPIYGDMTIQLQRWKDAEKALRGWKCRFLVPSQASKRQILSLANMDEKFFSILKHPINSQYFKLKELKNDRKKSFIYAGRISFGKNIFQLINTFNKALQVDETLKLNIYGEIDDIGFRFHEVTPSQKNVEEQFYKLLNASHQNISYHGHIQPNKLLDLYQQHQYFVSMSTYHDEDFGLAVPQALASGCTPVLSRWGGYKDFDPAKFVQVNFSTLGMYQISEGELLKFLINPTSNSIETNQNYAKKFMPSKIADDILFILEREFGYYKGQTEVFHSYCDNFYKNNSKPFLNIMRDNGVKEMYQTIYRGYYEA